MRTVTREQPNSRQGFFRPLIRVIFSVGTLMALAACGGGGGGGDDPPTPPANPPANPAPEANAGADQTITLPTNSVQLQGSANDSGPAATLTYSWSVTTGSNVTLSAASSAATTATFAAEGTYVLTLTVSDGNSNDTDTVQIVVNPEPTTPPPANTAPVVEAGADQTIELPFTATLAGSATDDGPANALTYSWAVTSGAAGVTFDNAAAASTNARFPSAGSYELTLTANDGTVAGSDAVLITVNPAVYPAADDNSPNGGWTRVAAADVGMDQALLDQAAAFAMTGGTGANIGTGGSGMIVRRGRLVHSWGNIGQRFDMKSATKSIGGIVLGIATDNDVVALGDRAQTYLPEIGVSGTNNPDWLDDITLLQLSTHTAGFAKRGEDDVALLYEPGTHWFYSDGGLNWLADLLTGPEAFDDDLNTVLAPVWSTLGVELTPEQPGVTACTTSLSADVCWRANVKRPGPHPSGIEHRELASGIWTNANAMARVGLLFLRNGLWANDQRVVSQEFVETVSTPPAEVAGTINPVPGEYPDATVNYGVLWWTNATGPNGRLPIVPSDAYWAWGLGDSLIIVIPSLDLVIVRAGVQTTAESDGRVWNDEDWNGDYAVLAPFLDPIVTSVTAP